MKITTSIALIGFAVAMTNGCAEPDFTTSHGLHVYTNGLPVDAATLEGQVDALLLRLDDVDGYASEKVKPALRATL